MNSKPEGVRTFPSIRSHPSPHHLLLILERRTAKVLNPVQEAIASARGPLFLTHWTAKPLLLLDLGPRAQAGEVLVFVVVRGGWGGGVVEGCSWGFLLALAGGVIDVALGSRAALVGRGLRGRDSPGATSCLAGCLGGCRAVCGEGLAEQLDFALDVAKGDAGGAGGVAG